MVSVVDEPGIGIARFSVERYHQMIAAEILTSDDSLELVEEFTDPVSDPEARYATTRTLTNGSVDLGPFEIDVADLLRPAG
jgi:hypothetical protein